MANINPIEESSASPESISPTLARSILFGLVFLGWALRVFTALKIPLVLHQDEIFQTQEPAHRLAFGYGVISWEWITGIRSWVFPAFLAGVMRVTAWVGAGAHGYLAGITVVLSLLSLTTVWFGFAWAKREGGIEAGLIAAGTCAIWYTMVAYGPRALTEVVATDALLPGFYLGFYGGSRLGERTRMFLAGAFCGLAMCLRIQLAPTVAFALGYFCFQHSFTSGVNDGAWKKRVAPIALGLVVPVAMFGAVDAVTWSYPFQSFVRYVDVNLFAGGGHLFGRSPWYWYLAVPLPAELGPLLLLAIWGARRNRFLAWTALIILASHTVIPHKEDRFLYPMFPLVITLAALGTVDLAHAWAARRQSLRSSRSIVAAGLALPIVFTGVVLIGLHFVDLRSGGIVAFDRLSEEPATCGIGLINLGWYRTGGYTHLHRNVPIIEIADQRNIGGSESFNALVTKGRLESTPTGFVLESCLNRVCLYERQGTCAAPNNNDAKNIVPSGPAMTPIADK